MRLDRRLSVARGTAKLHMRRFAACLLGVCLLLDAPAPLSATPPVADTPEIVAAREKARAAEAELDELQAQLELRAEEFEAVSEQLAETRKHVEDARIRLERAESDLGEARTRLEERAREIYRTGDVGAIEVFLGTKSFADFLTRLEWMRRINRNDTAVVAAVAEARDDVLRVRQSLERREAEESILKNKAKAAKAQVEDALTAQLAYLRDLEGEVARLVREEQERQARLAEEARRRAEEAARAAAQRAASGGPGIERSIEATALGNGHPEVVQVALQFVGVVDYVYGGATPAGFDCSGLTMYCYRQIGVNIPRTSRQQFRAGTHIPPTRLDLLVPGDLVFFGYDGDPSRVHHVGFYVGNGDYLHAPRTGEKVTISSLTERIASKRDYVGASRF